MPTAFTPLILIDPSHAPSARYLAAVDDLNQYANDPKYGGSVEEIKEIAKGIVLKSVTDSDTVKAVDKTSPGIVLPIWPPLEYVFQMFLMKFPALEYLNIKCKQRSCCSP